MKTIKLLSRIIRTTLFNCFHSFWPKNILGGCVAWRFAENKEFKMHKTWILLAAFNVCPNSLDICISSSSNKNSNIQRIFLSLESNKLILKEEEIRKINYKLVFLYQFLYISIPFKKLKLMLIKKKPFIHNKTSSIILTPDNRKKQNKLLNYILNT